MSGLLLSDCVLSRDIFSSLEFNCHIVMLFPVLVDCGVEDINGNVVIRLALIVIFLGSVELICSVGGILSVCIVGLVTYVLLLVCVCVCEEPLHAPHSSRTCKQAPSCIAFSCYGVLAWQVSTILCLLRNVNRI